MRGEETKEAEETEVVAARVWCCRVVRGGDLSGMKDWLEEGEPSSLDSSMY